MVISDRRPRNLNEMQKSHDISCRDSCMNEIQAPLFLTRAGVIDFHGLHFGAAAVLVPLQGVMILVGHLDDFAGLLFHRTKRRGSKYGRISAIWPCGSNIVVPIHFALATVLK
jgi:hypothetical protein